VGRFDTAGRGGIVRDGTSLTAYSDCSATYREGGESVSLLCRHEINTHCFKRKGRRARKEHRCGECHHIIPVGATYVYYSGVSQGDGDWRRYAWNFALCLSCDADWTTLGEVLYAATGEGGPCFGDLQRNVSEAFDLGYLDEGHPLVERWLRDEEHEETPPVPESQLF
jgi:hypothetical protein